MRVCKSRTMQPTERNKVKVNEYAKQRKKCEKGQPVSVCYGTMHYCVLRQVRPPQLD